MAHRTVSASSTFREADCWLRSPTREIPSAQRPVLTCRALFAVLQKEDGFEDDLNRSANLP
jgi:hypothetical protein